MMRREGRACSREWCAEIQDAYARLGHIDGLAVSHFTASNAEPRLSDCSHHDESGGSVERPDHGRESSEGGSAYVVEAWKRGYAPGEAPLQNSSS